MESKKPVCRYGAACYRKNPEHLKQFAHPGRDEPKATEPIPKNANSAKKDAPHIKRKRTNDPTAELRKTGPSITSYFVKKESTSASTSSTRGSPTERDNSVTVCAASDDSFSQNDPPDAKRKKLDESTVDETQSVDEEQQKNRFIDDDELHKESDDDKQNVKRKFLVDMPEDFYLFWEFCKTLEPLNPQVALRSTLGLELTGPYDVLGGNLKGVPWDKCVLHSRHYYDPPELVTVLKQQTNSENPTGYHIGYFRDDPKSTDSLLVSNISKESCELKIEGDSLFGVIRTLIAKRLEEKSLPAQLKEELKKINGDLSSKMTHYKGESIKDLVKQRNKLILTKCFHKLGLVVPYDETTELGYRPLPMNDRDLWRLLNKISNCSQDDKKRDLVFEPLQEVITLVQFANDECDYGMGLELGLDLFCHGNQYFHTTIEQLLPLAYELLQREEYSKIIQQHLKNRNVEPLDFRVKSNI